MKRTILLLTFAMICCASMAQVIRLDNSHYTVWYNPRTCNAERVTWCVVPAQLGSNSRDKAGTFRQDSRVPKPRAKSGHYTNSGYQRGHLCPSADFTASVSSMKETFILSNIVPMTPRLNTIRWKGTETATRILARLHHGVRVWVWTFIAQPDTTYLPGSPVAIPTSFAKQVYTMDTDSLLMEWSFTNDF